MSNEVQDIILAQLNRIEAKVDHIHQNGCSHGPDHARHEASIAELYNRVRMTENAQAEGRGKLIVVMLFAGGLLSAFFTWLGKHL